MGKWTRRGVLSAGVLGGTGLVIGIAVRPGNPTETAGHLVTGEGENLLHIYLKIDDQNRATAILPHSEMGQGAQTALTQMLAEELDADWPVLRDTLYYNQKLINFLNMSSGDQDYSKNDESDLSIEKRMLSEFKGSKKSSSIYNYTNLNTNIVISYLWFKYGDINSKTF